MCALQSDQNPTGPPTYRRGSPDVRLHGTVRGARHQQSAATPPVEELDGCPQLDPHGGDIEVAAEQVCGTTDPVSEGVAVYAQLRRSGVPLPVVVKPSAERTDQVAPSRCVVIDQWPQQRLGERHGLRSRQ